MSRKDYRKFAKMIYELRKRESFLFSEVHLKAIFEELCHIFYSDNSDFRREKFYTACGFNENKN